VPDTIPAIIGCTYYMYSTKCIYSCTVLVCTSMYCTKFSMLSADVSGYLHVWHACTVPLLINEGSFSFYSNSPWNQCGRFLKNVLISEKKVRCRFFSRVCMVGCMGRISHTNLKNRRIYPLGCFPESQFRKIT
jgi:hypothetical protein